jgi:hypothetical protein
VRWEFAYIDLHLSHARQIGERWAQIARYGQDGWEPVGQVTFSYATLPTTTYVAQLMFKRPLEDAE